MGNLVCGVSALIGEVCEESWSGFLGVDIIHSRFVNALFVKYGWEKRGVKCK